MTDVQLLIFLKCLTLDLDDRIICILYQFQNNFSNFFSKLDSVVTFGRADTCSSTGN